MYQGRCGSKVFGFFLSLYFGANVEEWFHKHNNNTAWPEWYDELCASSKTTKRSILLLRAFIAPVLLQRVWCDIANILHFNGRPWEHILLAARLGILGGGQRKRERARSTNMYSTCTEPLHPSKLSFFGLNNIENIDQEVRGGSKGKSRVHGMTKRVFLDVRRVFLFHVCLIGYLVCISAILVHGCPNVYILTCICAPITLVTVGFPPFPFVVQLTGERETRNTRFDY